MSSKWLSSKIKINQNDLFYWRTGGNKKQIILAHGFTDDSSCWFELAKDLEKDFDLIMYDAIGHGLSTRIVRDKPLDMVEDLQSLITSLKLNKPIVMGHSMGAAVGAGLAATYPELLSALILEDVPWIESVPKSDAQNNQEQANKHNYPEIIARLQTGTVEEATKFSKKHHPEWIESAHEPWASSKMKFDLTFFSTKWPDSPNWQEVARKIKCPTLLLTGDISRGGLVSSEVAIKALKLIPGLEWAHIPNAGHLLRYEQYELYIKVVKSFLIDITQKLQNNPEIWC
ncbi:MAG: alpha/beta hydrolase [Anaerolineaceae bacterium]|nr:alpha/beta hydrolase [Anaerolineaceae bacterium]